MKRSLVLILATLLVSAMGVALATHTEMSGKVISSTPSVLVIETDAGDQVTFAIDTTSEVPATMTPGDRVNVAYSTQDSGRYHAATVTMSTGTASNNSRTYNERDAGYSSRTAMNEPGGNDTLPRTASPLPLITLIGAISVGAALGLRAASRFAH